MPYNSIQIICTTSEYLKLYNYVPKNDFYIGTVT